MLQRGLCSREATAAFCLSGFIGARLILGMKLPLQPLSELPSGLLRQSWLAEAQEEPSCLGFPLPLGGLCQISSLHRSWRCLPSRPAFHLPPVLPLLSHGGFCPGLLDGLSTRFPLHHGLHLSRLQYPFLATCWLGRSREAPLSCFSFNLRSRALSEAPISPHAEELCPAQIQSLGSAPPSAYVLGHLASPGQGHLLL